MRIIDISVSITGDLVVWPRRPGVSIDEDSELRGDELHRNTALHMDVHTGTHIDAPGHCLSAGAGALHTDLYRCVGAVQVGIEVSAAEWCVERKLVLVGIDYLSIQAPRASDEVHRKLLSVGTVVLEGVDLREVAPGPYQLVCLPLRREAADGAPVRAILTCEAH